MQLNTTTNSYEDNSPIGDGFKRSIKMSYEPIHKGQAAYLMKLCEENNIAVRYLYGEVKMYSSEKLTLFKELIEKSLLDKKTAIFGRKAQIQWSHSSHVYCVGIRDKDTLYTIERSFPQVVVDQYIGAIPETKTVKIFDNIDSMKRYLLKEEKIKLL